ncbi:MAG: glycosyltransferase family 1 protein [Prevotella sp.]|nr:glycosyltransferase family 1 protein [Prevotella sp.]
MKILLFEEYSSLHNNLAKGLKELGHHVTLVGNGNSFRDFPRDIDIKRGKGRLAGLCHYLHLRRLLPQFSGYDIVQLINPDCFGLKAERQYPFYHNLRHHNKKMVVGAFGCDWYWVDDGIHHQTFRYGDFYIGNKRRTDFAAQKFIDEYINTPKGEYTRYVMEDADWIPTCLYEYQTCYSRYFPNKTQFIPLPVVCEYDTPVHTYDNKKVRFFIGIDKERSIYKGTDIMYKALQDVALRHPEKCEIVKAESLPFEEYTQLMNRCDVILDQLYSYTPSMNSLLAMSKGIIVVGGGEPENYEIINEDTLRPIINVEPTYESVCSQLEWLLDNTNQINRLKEESIAYVKKHHDYRKVAKQYEVMYEALLQSSCQ